MSPKPKPHTCTTTKHGSSWWRCVVVGLLVEKWEVWGNWQRKPSRLETGRSFDRYFHDYLRLFTYLFVLGCALMVNDYSSTEYSPPSYSISSTNIRPTIQSLYNNQYEANAGVSDVRRRKKVRMIAFVVGLLFVSTAIIVTVSIRMNQQPQTPPFSQSLPM